MADREWRREGKLEEQPRAVYTCAQALAGIGYESWPTRWRHRSILCMPDESTRLGSDTELTARPTPVQSIHFRVEHRAERGRISAQVGLRKRLRPPTGVLDDLAGKWSRSSRFYGLLCGTEIASTRRSPTSRASSPL